MLFEIINIQKAKIKNKVTLLFLIVETNIQF